MTRKSWHSNHSSSICTMLLTKVVCRSLCIISGENCGL